MVGGADASSTSMAQGRHTWTCLSTATGIRTLLSPASQTLPGPFLLKGFRARSKTRDQEAREPGQGAAAHLFQPSHKTPAKKKNGPPQAGLQASSGLQGFQGRASPLGHLPPSGVSPSPSETRTWLQKCVVLSTKMD